MPPQARIRPGARSALLLPLALLAASALAGRAPAQAPPPSFEVSRRVDSGWVANLGDRTATIASFPVSVPGAAWLRLGFEEVVLPERGVKLRMTSVRDGGQQELDARQVLEWRKGSAYFNGDDVQVEIVAEPNTGRCRVVLTGITAGVPPIPTYTQCGSSDDRQASTDPRSARAMPIGCSAWMIDDCSHNFLTAGHCSGVLLQMVEFNVPPSNGDGSVNHPSPADQYTVDVTSKQFVSGGSGNDWGYFGVYPNPVTGLRPFQRQQATFHLVAWAPSPTGGSQVRVTGYGIDVSPSENNQVQQTSTGPYMAHGGTTLTYRADTEDGNSGSPVLLEPDGVAIGIHTNGGCSTTGGTNSGTAAENPGLRAALQNPLGQCACRGEWNPYCTGKVNSQGCLQTIVASGTPSLSGGPGSFEIEATQVLNQKLGVLFYGFAPANTPFQGGTACVGSPMRRTFAQSSGGNDGPPDCSGTFHFDMGARIASGVDPQLTIGANVFAQYFSRDPASPSGPYGLTNGLQFTIGP